MSRHSSKVATVLGSRSPKTAGELADEFKQPRGLPVALRPLMLPKTETVGDGGEVPVLVGLVVRGLTVLDGLKVGHKVVGT